MLLRLRALADRMRESLFYVPAVYVVVAVAGAWLLVTADREVLASLDRVPILLRATVDSARSTLSTLAAATITVAGIVFSVTVVSVQLASTQFSPRVLRNFLRDRLSQHIIGIVVGTFTYCLLVLTTVRARPDAVDEAAPTAALTVAIVLGVAAVVAIVAFLDHSARSMQVGRIIERITDQTLALIDARYPTDADYEPDRPQAPMPDGDGIPIASPRDGWVQQIDDDALREALPPGGTVRLEVAVGDHVVQDRRLATAWVGDPDDLDVPIGSTFAIGNTRTMQQDVAFGLRQLVDIGLRALSPGINDPTTADEVLGSLTVLLSRLLRRDLPPAERRDDEGRRLIRARHLTHSDYIWRAFDQIRVAAAGQPAVLIALLRRLAELHSLVGPAATDTRAEALEREAELLVTMLDDGPLSGPDRDRVRRVAEHLNLVAEPATDQPEEG